MATSTEKVKQWRLKNPERWKTMQLTYRLKSRGVISCKLCDAELPYPCPGRKYCPDCFKLNRREVGRLHRAKRFKELADYKMMHGCSKCGYNKCPSALHFHHLDPQVKETRVWVPRGAEFDKCILVCANCHFEIHYKEENKLTNEDEKIKTNGDVY